MSFPLEVEDADLTKEGLAYKWDAPKFIQVFLKKRRLLAVKAMPGNAGAALPVP